MEIVIDSGLVEDIIDFAKENHPGGMTCLLSGSFKKDTMILESIKLQGFGRNEDAGSLLTGRTQVTSDTMGILNSHPESKNDPSKEELDKAAENKGILLTIDHPYSKDDIRIFNPNGTEFDWTED